MPEEISDTIKQAAQSPAKATGDSGSVEQHPLQDQIAADKYLKSLTAMTRKKKGLRFMKLVPPGAD
jgi:hypothetical protein